MFGKKDRGDLIRGKFLADMTILLALAVLAMVVLASLAQLKSDNINPSASYNLGILNVLQHDKYELDQIVRQVRGKVDLPWTEKPILVNIDNPDSFLGAGKFYELARAGCKLLIYPKSSLIILYDPIEDKVLSYGRLDIKFMSLSDRLGKKINLPITTEDKKEEAKVVVASSSLKISVINGSKVKGLASKTAKILAENKNLEIVEVGNAGKFSYDGNLVVDLGQAGQETNLGALAKLLDAKIVKEMPAGENNMNKEAGAIVILGNK